MMRWQAAKIEGLVDAAYLAASPFTTIALPDGPGYYLLLNLRAARTAISGTPAANYRPAIYETNVASVFNEVYRPNANVAVANPSIYPARSYDGLPGRGGISLDGNWHLDFGADVDGDGFTAVVLVCRIR